MLSLCCLLLKIEWCSRSFLFPEWWNQITNQIIFFSRSFSISPRRIPWQFERTFRLWRKPIPVATGFEVRKYSWVEKMSRELSWVKPTQLLLNRPRLIAPSPRTCAYLIDGARYCTFCSGGGFHRAHLIQWGGWVIWWRRVGEATPDFLPRWTGSSTSRCSSNYLRTLLTWPSEPAFQDHCRGDVRHIR